MMDPNVSTDIELVLVRDTFVPEYVQLAHDDYDYLAKWLEWPRFCKTKEDFNSFIADSIDGYESGNSMNCTILYKGVVAGTAGFNKIDRKLGRVEIGYWLGSRFQKKGIVTKVCRHLINYAFTIPDIDKVQILVAIENLPSRAVCERLNMSLEGVVGNEEGAGDKVLSHAIYALHRHQAQVM